jgi:Flp pilus assembly protein TadD
MKSPTRHQFSSNKRADTLQVGLAHHRAGRLDEASARYASIPAGDPHHADALNLTGVIARQQGDLIRSERLILQAIRLNPDAATYHHHLARTFESLRRTSDAAIEYRRAIALNAADIDSLRLLARLVLTLGQNAEAISLFERVLKLDAREPDTYYSLGAIHKSTGDYATALVYYRRAIALFPDSTDSLFNLAMALYEAGKFEDCIPYFQQLIQASPDDDEAHNLLGQAFHEQMNYDAARRCYLKALELKPESHHAMTNLGALLLDLGDLASAEVLLRRALAIEPKFMNAHSNLGTVYSKKGMTNEAIQCLRNVLSIDPRNVGALCSLGFLMFNLGDEEGAEACYRLALKVQPDSPLALFNLSSSLLTAGRFQEGWEAYEMRWRVRQFASEGQPVTQPRWNGEDLTGRRIYVHSEQGFGDTLHFVRYALLLVELGAEVILAVQPALLALLRDLDPSIQVTAKGTGPLPDCDFYCPLLSLPRIFQANLTNLPAHVPYVHPRVDDLPHWSQRIDSAQLRVGIVWSGNPLHTRDRIRSLPLTVFSQVFDIPGISFYSLQKGPAAEQLTRFPDVVNLDAELRDFTDTAAAIAHLDLVITVDTAVAHLAGAMGKPVWILVSRASDWRWLTDRTDSPWYPSVRLFRQTALGEWDEVMAQVYQALEEVALDS